MALKTPFCAQEDELLNLIALSCGRLLLTEEGQTHPVVLSHNT